MKKVAHFIRKSSQLRASFIQNQVLNHIDYKPVIVCKYHSGKSDEGFVEFENDFIPVLNLWNESGLYSRLLFRCFKKITGKDVIKIKMFLKEHNVDILHFHYGTDAGIYYPLLKNPEIPSVISFYGYDAYSFPGKYFGYGKMYLHNRVFKFTDCIFAMSEEMKNDLIKIGANPGRIKIHYHGVIDSLSDFHREYYTNTGKINLLMLSYLDPVKGHLFVLRALKVLISEEIGNFLLIIAGDGHYKNVIRKYIDKYELNSFVKLIGAVEYKSFEYVEVFRKADIFLHPSVITKDDKEGIPGALVEAMLSGLPVISTYHGGIPYIIENNKAGLLVNEWDVKSLADAIKSLIINPDLRCYLGTNAGNYAIENLLLKNKEIELENIYDELINTKKQLKII